MVTDIISFKQGLQRFFFFDGFTEHLGSDELGLRSFDTGKKRQFLPLGIYLTVIPVGRNVRWLLV